MTTDYIETLPLSLNPFYPILKEHLTEEQRHRRKHQSPQDKYIEREQKGFLNKIERGKKLI